MSTPGYIDREEALCFFQNYFRFVLFGKSEESKGNYSEQEYGVRMVKHVFIKYGARPFPGITIGQFSSIEKINFLN